MPSEESRTPTYRRYYRRARRQGHGRLKSVLLAFPAKQVADLRQGYQQSLKEQTEEIKEAKKRSSEIDDWSEVLGRER